MANVRALTDCYDDICAWDNLLLAYRRASKGKRGHGAVAAFEYRLEDHLLTLQQELRAQVYRPGRYTSFLIHEPKRRLISAAPFRDRVVHHAFCNVVEPVFERSFVAGSYANRKSKGTHRALERVQQLSRRHRFVLQCDVRQFFPSLDHEILQTELSKRVRDRSARWLADRILEGGAGILDNEYDMTFFPGDDLLAVLRPRGLPIGNLTSQFWANVYMNPLDHFVARALRCRSYVRYVDDFLIFADDPRTLWHSRQAVIERLAALRLTIHPSAHVRPVSEGIPFLGFVVYPERRRLRRRKGIQFVRRLRGLVAARRTGAVRLDEVSASIRGWINHVRYANTVGLRKSVLRAAVL